MVRRIGGVFFSFWVRMQKSIWRKSWSDFFGTHSPFLTEKPDLASLREANRRSSFFGSMNEVQRKYKILRFTARKGLEEGVNELIQREYKDKDGFLYQSSGRWQCLGTPFLEKEYWHQAVVFIQEED